MRRVPKEREIVSTIQYMEHVKRGEKYRILQTIMQGKIQGKRSIGRRRNSWLKNLRDWMH